MTDKEAIGILYHMKYLVEHPVVEDTIEKSTALSLAIVALEKKIERENMNFR